MMFFKASLIALLMTFIASADTPPPNTVKAKLYSGDGVTPITATGGSLDVNITGGGGGGGTVDQGNAGLQAWLVSVVNFPITQTISGSVSILNFPSIQTVSGTVSVSNFPSVQPISAVALPLPSGAATSANQTTANTSLASIDSKLTSPLTTKTEDGSGNPITSTVTGPKRGLDVNVTNATTGDVNIHDSSGGNLTSTGNALNVNVTNSPSSTVNQGTGGTSAWKVDGSAVTQPISAASLPLPSNAAQETGGHLASIDSKLTSPLSVNVGNFPASQTVNGTVTANIGTTNGLALDSTLSALSAKFNSLGQKTMANSAPVVIASDQSSIPVTGTFFQATQPVSVASLPLPSNAAQETGGHLASIDTKLTSPLTVTGTVTSNIGTTNGLALDSTVSNVQGSSSGGISGSKSSLSGGVFNTSAPTLTNGQQAALQLDSSGNLKITPAGGSTSVTQGTSPWVVGQSSGSNLHADIDNFPATQTVSGTVAATQSGAWTTGRTWSLLNTTDSVNVGNFPSTFAVTQSTNPWTVNGTVTSNIGTTNGLALDATLSNPQGSVSGGTAGTKSNLVGGVYNSTSPTLTNGQQASLQFDSSGNLKTNASVSGTITANQGTSPWVVGQSSGSNLHVDIDNFPATQAATQSGTWNINNITGTVSLPTGASTSANQTNGNQQTQIVEGGNTATVTGSNALKVDGSAVTQPISGTVTTNPASAAPDISVSGSLAAACTTPSSCGAGSTITATVSSLGSAVLNLEGTWVGSVIVETTNDGGTTWNQRNTFISGVMSTTAITANGYYRIVGVGAYQKIRARMTAFTSGSATATLTASIGADVVGVVSSNAANLNAQVSGVYNSTLPTLSSGQINPLQLDPNGRVIWATDQNSSGTITTTCATPATGCVGAGASVQVGNMGYGSAQIQVAGTFTGASCSVYGSIDNANWVTLLTASGSTGTYSTNAITATGKYRIFRISSLRYMMFACTALASGTIPVVFEEGFPVGTAEVVQLTAANLQVTNTPAGLSYKHISGAATTTVKSGSGTLHTICYNNGANSSSVVVYDNTAGSGTVIASMGAESSVFPQCGIYDIGFATGLTIVTTNGTTDLTISYQ